MLNFSLYVWELSNVRRLEVIVFCPVSFMSLANHIIVLVFRFSENKIQVLALIMHIKELGRHV